MLLVLAPTAVGMDEFVQKMLRDHQGARSSSSEYENSIEDVELVSTKNFDFDFDIVVVPDNARVFADAVPKILLSLPKPASATASSNRQTSSMEQREDRWGAIIRIKKAPYDEHILTRNRWGSNQESLHDDSPTAPRRKVSVVGDSSCTLSHENLGGDDSSTRSFSHSESESDVFGNGIFEANGE